MDNSPRGNSTPRATLVAIARQAMVERGLEPDFSSEALQQLKGIDGAAGATGETRDLRDQLWVSIDNDDSRDLDQLTVAESLANGQIRILVAVADVDALVRKDSAIDGHASRNTTSVYTPAVVFPMLPTPLSNDLTSLNEDQDRMALVVDMVFAADGSLANSDLYRALVQNHAKLAYNSVAAWFDRTGGPTPSRILQIPRLEEILRLQDGLAQRLMELRHLRGALSLESVEARAVFAGENVSNLELEKKNRAKQLVEEFMIAANGVTATYLASRNFPSLRRVLRAPARWDRIVQLALRLGTRLPDQPDAPALEAFLLRRRRAEPDTFADLSLAVVKLLGKGEYVLDPPGEEAPAHFGLAVRDYTHSTAPNRRFPDLITQRLLKAAIAGTALPYSLSELAELAQHCTRREDDAAKVERRVRKSAAALLLSDQIGRRFKAIVTGAGPKGTFVRVFQPPVEGMLGRGFENLDVGDHVRVTLVRTDVERGFIDFARDLDPAGNAAPVN